MRALFLLLAVLVSAAAPAQERVLEFHSDIRIDAKGALAVTETISVEARGNQIKRGILRDFPTDYRDRTGALVRVQFDVLKVTRDGAPEPYALERLANGVRIRIGSASVFLSPGRHVYAIGYRTSRQLGFFKEHDELYWNVNGNGWTFAFYALSAEVALPAPVEASRLRLEAYTGYFGATGRDYEARATANGGEFRATRRLAAGEGLTIVLGFPKGIVAAPTLAERLGAWLGDNRGVLAGLAGFALLFAFLWWRWTLVGRDPRAGPKFPRYDPPPGLGPAGARYVDRMDCDDRCFAAALIGLGQRGFVRIRQRGDAYEIERTGKPVEWLPGEKKISDLLLGPAKSVAVGKTHDPGVQAARDGFRADLAAHFGERLFSKNRGSLFAGIALAGAGGAAMFVLEAPELFIGIAAGTMVVALILFSRWLPAYSVEGRKLQDGIEGLRQYLGVAEADELRRMKAPPQTKEEFAKLLPYAVALDVEKTWADRFAATIGAAAVAAAVADYYSTDSGGGLFDRGGVGGLTDSISGLGSTISSASTPPGSSSGSSDSGGGGGGGGGSSGGGGGGGGGSGW